MRFILLNILLGCSFLCQAQIGQWLSDNVKHHSPSPLVRLETRNSFISSNNVQMKGLQLGFKYGEQLKLGMGIYGLANKSIQKTRGTGLIDVTYIAPFIEYNFFRKGRYSASMPLLFGLGQVTLENERFIEKKAMAFYETVLVGNYHFLKYFSAGLGLGYRVALVNTSNYGVSLNSPIYLLKFNVYFKDIFRDIKNKE